MGASGTHTLQKTFLDYKRDVPRPSCPRFPENKQTQNLLKERLASAWIVKLAKLGTQHVGMWDRLDSLPRPGHKSCTHSPDRLNQRSGSSRGNIRSDGVADGVAEKGEAGELAMEKGKTNMRYVPKLDPFLFQPIMLYEY
jgi:hypothetical protein